MSTIEERFSAALHGSARAWRLAVDRRLRHLGISQSSWMAIALTAKEKEPPSQTRLANRVGVEDPTMVATIDRLVKAGYMIRTPSATDRRVKLLSLTESGMQVYRSVKQEADAVRGELLAKTDPAVLAIVTGFLEQMQSDIESGI
ncbi:UNVERIFIED_ORG: MarR family transcriptional regulator for hemolysin [Zoogloea ramigera]|uniref:MarR family transcriptional regulator n=1 Tax=Duganella zoogloeoides TaxID=75659 RepID=A0ABZ0XRY1_9BURK|nr:MarR family transcriptional regulator [Duganella zoogloeoides]WQH02502.1 MarR family transcriptional regulator [Duganella zoogloeoides]